MCHDREAPQICTHPLVSTSLGPRLGSRIVSPEHILCDLQTQRAVIHRDWAYLRSEVPALQLLGLRPGLWCAPAPPHSMSTHLLPNLPLMPPATPSQCCGQLPCRHGSGQSTGHLLPGCFLRASSPHLLLPLTPLSFHDPLWTRGQSSHFFLCQSCLLPRGYTGRWDSGSRASSPMKKNPKMYFPFRLYPQTGGCPQREAVCSTRFYAPSPLPRAPDPEAAAPGK